MCRIKRDVSASWLPWLLLVIALACYGMCGCTKLKWITYRYIHASKHTVFLIALISVGLAQARPNYVYAHVYILFPVHVSMHVNMGNPHKTRLAVLFVVCTV